MKEWIANGVALAWLIDPYDRQVVVNKLGTETLTVTGNSPERQRPRRGLCPRSRPKSPRMLRSATVNASL
jgi:hypothetical protein